MSKFDGLISLLDKLNNDEFGTWKIDIGSTKELPTIRSIFRFRFIRKQ